MALDGLCLAAAWLFAAGRAEPASTPAAITIGATVAGMAELTTTRLNRSRGCTLRSLEFVHLLRVPVASAAGAWICATVVGEPLLPSTALLGAIGCFALLVITRAFVAGWFRRRRARGIGVRRVVLVGTNAEADEMAELLQSRPDLGYQLVGCAGPPPPSTGSLETITWLGPAEDAAERAVALGASGLVVAVTALERPDLQRLVTRALGAHLHVQMSSGIGLLGHRRLVRTPVGHDPWCYIEANTRGHFQDLEKRALDLAITLPLLVVALPVLGLAAIAIKLDDGGPVLFRQVRVGRDGGLFRCLKLRTMTVDAELLLDGVKTANQRSGPLFKVSSDPRVTRVGRALRASSLDELPQLINVVRGEMSLVGPRPALPEEASQFDDDLRARVQVPPGITGLWQVEARDNPSFHAYRHLDLFYIENRSLVLDLTIIAMTVPTVAMRLWRAERSPRRFLRRKAEIVDVADDTTHALEAS